MASADVGLGTMGLGTGPLGGGYQKRLARGEFLVAQGLGTTSLGTSPLGQGVPSRFEGTSSRAGEELRTARGEFHTFEGESTITFEVTAISEGEFGTFEGEAIPDTRTRRYTDGEFGTFEGESIRDPLSYERYPEGYFGVFEGDSGAPVDLERVAHGEFGTFEGDTETLFRVIERREAHGEFYAFEGSGTTLILNWLLDGEQVHELIEEERTWDSLTLVFKTSASILDERIRPLGTNAGQFEIVTDSEGAFETVDRAGGANTYPVEAPLNRQDVRYIDTYLVDEISDVSIDQSEGDYEVEITLVPEASKTIQDPTYGNLSPASNEWHIEMHTGDIATSRVNAELQHQLVKGTDTYEFSVIMTPKETRRFEENLSHLEAVDVVEVPDGDNYAVDNHPDSYNTITLSPPSGAGGESSIAPDTEFVVQTWTTEWINDDFYELTFTATEKV